MLVKISNCAILGTKIRKIDFMRKKMKAAWFLAALLSAGLAAFPAMAAQGWAQENSSWVYYDSNGNKVYNEWKKGADGQWRYLNGEGYMAVNAWADSDYYVDSNGIMLTIGTFQVSGLLLGNGNSCPADFFDQLRRRFLNPNGCSLHYHTSNGSTYSLNGRSTM